MLYQNFSHHFGGDNYLRPADEVRRTFAEAVSNGVAAGCRGQSDVVAKEPLVWREADEVLLDEVRFGHVVCSFYATIRELAEMPTCLLIQEVNPHDTFHQADTNN